MRAILLNSARKLPYWHKGELTSDDDHVYSLDFIQGAGALNAVNAYEHLIAGRGGEKSDGTIGWDNNAIERIAGGDHYRNYRQFIRSGGVPSVVGEAGRGIVASTSEASPSSAATKRICTWSVSSM